jgi:Zn-dependent protease
MLELNLAQKILIFAVPILYGITIHEVAHGWLANKLGDPTAKDLKRLSVNPLKHVDVIGTIIVPGVLLLLGGFIFGWAKSVPVNWRNLHHPKRDMALVALAGPVANLLMACMWALVAKSTQVSAHHAPSLLLNMLALMAQAGILVNFVLLSLNLIPIPPLDGSRVISAFLSQRMGYYYNRLEPYGFAILLFLMITGVLNKIISYPVVELSKITLRIFGVTTT